MNFLQQTKLTKEEWTKIEKPIENKREKKILEMIEKGYTNIDIKWDDHICLSRFLKIDKTFDDFIFHELLQEKCITINKNNILMIDHKIHLKKSNKKISKMDKIKLENSIRLMKQSNKMNEIIESIESIRIDRPKISSYIYLVNN